MLLNTKQKQKKFIITMVIIIACATMVNYGLFSLLDTYYFTSDSISQNILIMVIIISMVSIIMFLLIPKEVTDNLMDSLENNRVIERTPAEQLQDMIDEDASSNGNNNDLRL